MIDTPLLIPSLCFTTPPNYTSLHYTCRHFTSSHLNFTHLHFTTVSFGLNPFIFPTAPFHLTSLHFTSLHFTALVNDFRHTSIPFTSLCFIKCSDKFTCTYLRSWLFLEVTQRSLVATYVSGQHSSHVFQGQAFLCCFRLLDPGRWD